MFLHQSYGFLRRNDVMNFLSEMRDVLLRNERWRSGAKDRPDDLTESICHGQVHPIEPQCDLYTGVTLHLHLNYLGC